MRLHWARVDAIDPKPTLTKGEVALERDYVIHDIARPAVRIAGLRHAGMTRGLPIFPFLA
jgi:hypothetical protein